MMSLLAANSVAAPSQNLGAFAFTLVQTGEFAIVYALSLIFAKFGCKF
jgi:hypothetical protein